MKTIGAARSVLAMACALWLPERLAAKPIPLMDQGHDALYGYPYGGTSSGGVQNGPQGKTMVFRGDDREYSGWTIGFPPVQLSRIRRSGGISFQIRGAKGGERLVVGLMDNGIDGKERMVEVRLDLTRYARIDTSWTTVRIPFADWKDDGIWWDPKLRRENPGRIDWDRVACLRLSSRPGDNSKQVGADHRFTVEYRDLMVQDSIPHFDRDAYWKAFKGDAPERLVLDPSEVGFRSPWIPSCDGSSRIDTSSAEETGHGRLLQLRYCFNTWAQVLAPAEKLPKGGADWGRHRALALDVWTDRPAASIKVGILDRGDENWSVACSVRRGWNRVVVPFRDFELDPWWQPADADMNRILDLEGIRGFLVQPLDRAVTGILRVGRIGLTNVLDTASKAPVAKAGRILSNQVGYLPPAPKRFFVAGMGARKGWALLDSNGRAVKQGDLAFQGFWASSGDTLRMGDFTGWTRPGLYRIAVGDSQGPQVRIADTVYRAVSRASLRAFWFQRCGVDLPVGLAGPWARKAGHPDTALSFVEVPGRKGRIDVHGGWYDAGDYGKYVVNAGIALGNLLSIQETWPESFPDGSLSIPESGNGVGDLLDEMRWELEWILRMQDKDGGVFFKVGGRAWDGWIEPADSKVERFVIGKSSISSLDAAAVLAQASRTWRKVDRAFSRRCLVGAERAWKWATSRPFVPAPRNVEGTGPYSDEDWTDERFWAATELWLSTGRKEFRDRAASLADSVPVQSSAWWAEVGNMGWFSLARLGKGDPLARAARMRIAAAADSIVERLESSPGRVPDEIFPWGSNDRELEAAITLIQAWFSDPKDAYRDAALETLDWVLGRNPLDASFVTGFGTRPVRHVLSRATLAKDIAPFPGLMAGGPDGKHDDDVTADPEGVRWYGEAPAASWKDDPLSYATNEVAINWNSSLAFVLAWADRLPAR